mmetsp:Transcript_65607/g.132017  ORF Transcript_65607/g.132017 Transcript_65607/m.132017 type:complete len:250 (-) Transcript_65607:12-761(-)
MPLDKLKLLISPLSPLLPSPWSWERASSLLLQDSPAWSWVRVARGDGPALLRRRTASTRARVLGPFRNTSTSSRYELTHAASAAASAAVPTAVSTAVLPHGCGSARSVVSSPSPPQPLATSPLPPLPTLVALKGALLWWRDTNGGSSPWNERASTDPQRIIVDFGLWRAGSSLSTSSSHFLLGAMATAPSSLLKNASRRGLDAYSSALGFCVHASCTHSWSRLSSWDACRSSSPLSFTAASVSCLSPPW